MAKYLDTSVLAKLCEIRKRIYKEREDFYKEFKIDLLDTDTLSSSAIYEIVCQYDKNYNINFSRNGEDAISNGVLVEQKCTRIPGPYTKTGKLRKQAGQDACFTFHAHGDIIYPRYIFAALDKETLTVVRLYDVSNDDLTAKIQSYLLLERQKYDDRCALDPKHKKRDTIVLPESLLQGFNLTRTVINECLVYKN